MEVTKQSSRSEQELPRPLPTIAQRLASAEKELGYLSAFLVKVLSDGEQQPSLPITILALENQFTEGLKLVVRIRALVHALAHAQEPGALPACEVTPKSGNVGAQHWERTACPCV